jgi:hypothetical protein
MPARIIRQERFRRKELSLEWDLGPWFQNALNCFILQQKWGISDHLASRFDNFRGTEAQSPVPPAKQFLLEAIFDRLLQTDLDSRMK